MSLTMLQRFEEKYIKRNSKLCWEWTATTMNNGYGHFWYNKKLTLAHRVSYQFYIGQIPNGICVLHKCDNRKCVNPNHLFLGTYQDNATDRKNKGRGNIPTGVKNPRTKLSIKQVKEIRKLLIKQQKILLDYKNHYTHRAIAEKYNVTTGAIVCIANGKNWKSVK